MLRREIAAPRIQVGGVLRREIAAPRIQVGGVLRREIAAPRIQVDGVLSLHSGRLSSAESHIRTDQAENWWATCLTAATQTRVIR